MFDNPDRSLITPDHEPGLRVAEVVLDATTTPARAKGLRLRRDGGKRVPLGRAPTVSCPQCRSAIRDRIALSAGYCARCREFTLMCAAGRRLVSPDVMTRTGWHWPCTSAGTTRWQVTAHTGVAIVLLCAVHGTDLASGRASWIVEPVFLGP
jgi:hypothetical protein